jgi:hypothetical protein
VKRVKTGVWRRWRSNGGDLEAQRELAVTIITDEVQLLLVARSGSIKEKVSRKAGATRAYLEYSHRC